jgi:hypothetical protein
LVAYTADRLSDTSIEVFVSPPNTSAGNLKVSGTPMDGTGVADSGQAFGWAPDSSRIAYIADQDTAGILELYTSTPDGLNNDLVSDIPPLPIVNRNVRDFQWQPSSTNIAYVADQDTDGKFELYVSPKDSNTGNLKVSGTTMTGTGLTVYDWAPDSSRIAYLADQITGGVRELFSSTPDGSANDIVSGVLVAGGEVQDFRWAPDSSGVGYRADQDIDNAIELFASQPNGNENTKLSGTLVNGGNVFSFDWVP